MKETKSKWLTRMFHYWCGRLELSRPVETRKDNRLDSCLAIDDWNDKNKICLKYHTRRIGQLPYCVLISNVFHEIGHLINKLPYETDKQIITSEYEAEMFSFKMMKKYYKQDYILLCKRLKTKKLLRKEKKEEPLYYEAFKNIKEWQYD